MDDPDVFVGLDVYKDTITIAIAEADRGTAKLDEPREGALVCRRVPEGLHPRG